MSALSIILSFPTVVFSVLLAVSLVYWGFVLIGALDHDALGGADHAIEGVAKGGLDAAAHKVGAAVDLPVDGLFASVFSFLRLRSVPLTVVVSFFAVFGFLFSGLGCVALGELAWYQSLPLFLGAAVSALLATSFAIRPLGSFFTTKRGTSHAELVGKILVVTTTEVSPSFGLAEYRERGAALSLPVRADSDARLRRGDRCLVIEWDEQQSHFHVVSLADAQPHSMRRVPSPTASAGVVTTDDVISAAAKRRR